jgi:hypothetical protein
MNEWRLIVEMLQHQVQGDEINMSWVAVKSTYLESLCRNVGCKSVPDLLLAIL